MSAPVLSLRGAALARGGRELWRGLDLDVAPGEFVAVLGPNGSGKTSLVRAVLGLVPLAAGRIEVLGAPPRRGNPRIGYIPQQRLLEAGTPVRGADLVGFGVNGARFGLPLPRRRDRQRIDALLDAVGARGVAGQPAAALSGGEQQRLRLGQALAGDPPLLLCDEPLLSLDPANQAVVSDLLDAHRRRSGAAVVFVTHDVNPVLDLVDRVLYLAGGRFRIGTPEQVLRSAVLSDLYGAHIDVVRVHDRLVVVGAGHDELAHVGAGG